ncbi:MAG: hypothetical protein MJ230_01385 [bacterium]|nr:hypothetical protein [bacterium]
MFFDVLKVSKSTKNGTVEYYCDKDGKNVFQIKVLNKNNKLDYFIELGKAGNRTTERFDQATIYRKYNVNGNDRDYVYNVIFKDKQSELYYFNDMTNALAEQGYIKYMNISSEKGKTLLQWYKSPPNDDVLISSKGENGTRIEL